VIGGLVSSTVLTLIVVPVLYFLVEGLIERIRIRRDEAAGGAARRTSWPAPEAATETTP
jgi:HAE1 family hydrophobic/amphiphilic exporter-1